MNPNDGNSKFVTYSIANTEWTKNGEVTNWIDVIAFGPQAEFAKKNLVKGQKIIIEGRPNADPYERMVKSVSLHQLLLSSRSLMSQRELIQQMMRTALWR